MMTYRIGILIVLVLSILGCQSQKKQSDNHSDKRPNIILIMADDMGYSDLGCFGSEIKTPNLDRLANNGVRMTNFYNAGRCCPSRASLLTGLYPHQAGVGSMTQDLGHPSYRGAINHDVPTIAQLLQTEGYNTYHSGKWHVGDKEEYWPKNKGFQKDLTFVNGAGSYYNLWPHRAGSDSIKMSYNGEEFRPGDGFYSTNAFSDYAVKFIEEDDEKPFFMYLAYNAPHWPLHALPEDIAKYKGKYTMGWDELRKERFKRMKDIGVIPAEAKLSTRTADLPAWEDIPEEDRAGWDTKMTLYAAVVDRMDQGIGKVIKALEDKGELDNTLIIFLSDNGGSPERMRNVIYPTDGEPGSDRSFPYYGAHWANVSNTPYSYYKAWIQEGGIASPFIAHWPAKIPKGTINTTYKGHIMDLMATSLDVAGLQYPTEYNNKKLNPTPSESLIPGLLEQESNGHELLFWEHEGVRAVRKGDWKLVSNKYEVTDKGWDTQISWQLFNLKEDPIEEHNVIDQYKDLAEDLRNEYDAWAKEVGALSPDEFFNMKAEYKRLRNEKPVEKY